MDSQDVGARPQRKDAARERAAELLARRSHDDRAPELAQLPEPAEQLEVVADRLSEPDPRVDPDALLGDALAHRVLDSFGEERPDIVDDVVVGGALLHRPG